MEYAFLQRRSNGKFWPAGYTVYGLCAAYNHATDPGLFLTDREHHVSARYARGILARMKRLGLEYGRDWKELSNGMKWPLPAWRHRVTPLTERA